MIKFDLHIHSFASKYKEINGIVDDSTKENISILINKLIENDIRMFSITDHNRFDKDLYLEIDSYLKDHKNELTILSGVEFDVKLDVNAKPCHIITIFNTNNDIDNYNKISEVINKNLLTNQSSYYKKDDYNRLLSEINLDVILIANQQSDINNNKHNTKSLNNSCDNPIELIKIGYISALEFQKYKVEGMLKNNLKAKDINIALISGSDCHTWEYYPKHDESKAPREIFYSEAEILPTFKGLLMAITSPQTRFNRINKSTAPMIKSININGNEILLRNGINVIIGENGSGKSTLLDIINDRVDKPYKNHLKKENNIIINKIDSCNMTYIEQTQIVNSFNNDTLLYDDKNFTNLDHREFEEIYSNFNKEIYDYIDHNISFKNCKDKLKETNLELKNYKPNSFYYINIKNASKQFTLIPNIHKTPKEDMENIIRKLNNIKETSYFIDNFKDEIIHLIESTNDIYIKILDKYHKSEYENKVRNLIYKNIEKYISLILTKTSSNFTKELNYEKDINNFNEIIINYIKLNTSKKNEPTIPKLIESISKTEHKGFEFQNVAFYNNIDVSKSYLKTMFNKNYTNLDTLLKINTKNDLKDAVTACTSIDQIEEISIKNFQKFINNYTNKTNKYIIESTGNKKIGDTLGELSLAYIKYISRETDFDVLSIDQPEDNISNKNINTNLLSSINAIRNKGQIIIVTHNPLLVVNLDADYIIYLTKTNNKISVSHGPLEYEENNVNILKIISDTMDGGRDAIQKRLKVYDCNN